jgi:hypothetical protein
MMQSSEVVRLAGACNSGQHRELTANRDCFNLVLRHNSVPRDIARLSVAKEKLTDREAYMT